VDTKWNDPSSFEDLSFLWERIQKSSQLDNVKAEIFLFLQLYGFPCQWNVDPLYDDPPLMVKNVVFPRPKVILSAELFIQIEAKGLLHTIKSMTVEEISYDRIRVTFFIPGCLRKCNPRQVKSHCVYSPLNILVEFFFFVDGSKNGTSNDGELE
jgi:hypothetical protein